MVPSLGRDFPEGFAGPEDLEVGRRESVVDQDIDGAGALEERRDLVIALVVAWRRDATPAKACDLGRGVFESARRSTGHIDRAARFTETERDAATDALARPRHHRDSSVHGEAAYTSNALRHLALELVVRPGADEAGAHHALAVDD